MTREADYTIQGFLYQFNKTLVELLRASDEAEITVEGIDEDIEVEDKTCCHAIQCKYHEAQDTFALSLIYKPLLQMMQHFSQNSTRGTKYRLYAYFPGMLPGNTIITVDNLVEAKNSANQALAKYTADLAAFSDYSGFLNQFAFEIGVPFDDLVTQVHQSLETIGLEKEEIETLYYPNAIHEIGLLSIKHDASQRRIRKATFVARLKTIRKTAISRWTLALKSRDRLLKARQDQLKKNLSINSRLRYFLISESAIENFQDEIVMFIEEYVSRYHFKPTHIHPPIFCLDCTDAAFRDIRVRLHKKGVVSETGYIEEYFDKTHFFRDPMVRKAEDGEQREFSIRLLRIQHDLLHLNEKKCSDLFNITGKDTPQLDLQDVNVERLDIQTFSELKFLLGFRNAYN